MSQLADPALASFTRVVERMLLILAACIPATGSIYLGWFGSGDLIFMHHVVHEVAIGVSLVASAFVAFVALRCYRSSGEIFVGWLALALIGETLIYLPHGVFTRLSHDHMALFLIYGPASRLAMAALLLVGLLQYDRPAHAPERAAAFPLWRWVMLFVGLDAVLAWVSLSWPSALPILRLVLEYSALTATTVAIIMMLLRPRSSPLMRLYAFSLVGFGTSSITFVVASPWNHLWWYAHAVFAAAFLLLGYGVLRAFHTTGSFSGVFSEEQLMEHLQRAKRNAEQAALQLQRANAELAELATTDSLTGAVNRRHFMDLAQRELQRALRSRAESAVLLIDLDRFKSVNDEYGHAAGDDVLRHFVKVARAALRSGDVIGRLGGEEFAVLLPDTGRDSAVLTATRICAAMRNAPATTFDGRHIHVSVSVGVAMLGVDGGDMTQALQEADRRLYAAKRAGRDRVVWSGGESPIDADSRQASLFRDAG